MNHSGPRACRQGSYHSLGRIHAANRLACIQAEALWDSYTVHQGSMNATLQQVTRDKSLQTYREIAIICALEVLCSLAVHGNTKTTLCPIYSAVLATRCAGRRGRTSV